MTIGLVLGLGLFLQAPPAARPAAAPARPGIVTGQLHKQDGSPADDVRIIAQLAPPPEVLRRPETGTQYYEAPPPTRVTFTDAQGRYRLDNVPPGRYYIVAGLLGQATYYPGSPEDNRATIVNVTPDSSVNLDFTLAAPIGGRVFGRVTPAAPAGTQERAVVSGPEMAEVLELPIHADGTFDLGHLPKGRYLMNIFPIYPGLTSQAFDVGDADLPPLTFVRPSLYTVSGRVVVDHGPVPITLLGFVTPDDNFIAATIQSDGTFRVRLQPATHRPDVAGMPAGYTVVSVKANGKDISAGLVVDKSDVTDVVVNVAAPDNLPALHGRVTGVAAARLQDAKVEMTADGAIAGRVSAPVKSDGTFEFPALTPGLYALTIPGVIEKPVDVVVTFFGDNAVTVAP